MQPPFLVAAQFAHRMNKNGTIDSICPRCYTTIATSIWEADLDRTEATHICDPSLNQFQHQLRDCDPRRTPSSRKRPHAALPWPASSAIGNTEPVRT